MIKLNLQRFVVSLLIISTGTSLCFSRQLRVGAGHQYATVYEASQKAIPGDTILISAGTSDKEYRLKPNSPAIGKGYESYSPITDFFNRPFRQKRSIGAVEIR